MARPEDSRVKIPALVHFTRLGYQYMSIKDMVRGVDYDSDTNIFYGLFLDAINKINNTDLSLEEAKKIIEELKIKLSNDDLGKAFFEILQKGYNGIKLIDYSPTKDKNSYVVVTELPYENGDDNFRPDIIVLINGMPLSFVEVKRQNNREGILAERERMTRRFSNPIYKKFVNLTQYTVFSNNNEYDDTDIEPIQGAFYASSNYGRMFFSKFREQRAEELDKGIKEIDEDVEKFILKDNNLLAIKGTSEYASSIRKDSPTNRIVTSLYSRDRLRFILQYGLCYKETVDKNGIKHIEKHIMRYPQIFATLAIRVRLSEGVKKGVIWHTQGSGKTALAFSNVHFLRDYYQNQGKIAKFYFIVDRLDLATQAKAEFEARGLKVNMISSKEDFKTNIAAVGETDNTGKTLTNYKALHNLIRLFGYDDLYIHFDVDKAIQMLNEVNNRISIINLKESMSSADDMSGILSMALDQISFQFRKIKEEELVIADAFRTSLEKARREIVDRCLDPKDPEYVALLDELKRIFKKKNIEELTSDEMKDLMGELDDLRKKAEKKNHEDQMLAKKYNGDVKYMRTHKRIMESPPPIADAVTIHKILMDVKNHADDTIAHNESMLDNEAYFIKTLQPFIINACKTQETKINIAQVKFIDTCISQEYFTERNWAS